MADEIGNTKLVSVLKKKYCEQCGNKNELEVHHIFPRADGGLDFAENIQTLCHTCHTSLHNCLKQTSIKNIIKMRQAHLKKSYATQIFADLEKECILHEIGFDYLKYLVIKKRWLEK